MDASKKTVETTQVLVGIKGERLESKPERQSIKRLEIEEKKEQSQWEEKSVNKRRDTLVYIDIATRRLVSARLDIACLFSSVSLESGRTGTRSYRVEAQD